MFRPTLFPILGRRLNAKQASGVRSAMKRKRIIKINLSEKFGKLQGCDTKRIIWIFWDGSWA